MDGVSLLLYGVIAASGIRILIDSQVDYNKPQDLILTSVILIIGVSSTTIHIGAAELKRMAFTTIIDIIMSLVFRFINIIRPEKTYITTKLESVNPTKK